LSGKGKHPGGRPTKFKPEYCEALIEFFDIEPYIKEVAESSKEYFATGEVKKETEKFKWMPNQMPTLYRFAKSINVAYSTVWRWAEKGQVDEGDEDPPPEFERFCNAYKEAKEIQKEFLISLGLSGVSPSPFAIFTAKNITDMRDKQEHEHKGKITHEHGLSEALKDTLNDIYEPSSST
jgi:hypothetical protein